MHESPKSPCVVLCFAKCSSFTLKLVLQKKDTKGRVAGLRKQTKEHATDQMCMDNIPVGLDESNNSLLSDSSEESLSTSLLSLSLFSVSLFTYIIIELHLIQKVLCSCNDNADQCSCEIHLG